MQQLEIDSSIDIAPPLETVIHGKYRLVRMLGEGASSWVYLARHHTIDTLTFAVKVLKPTYARDADVVKRFKREAFTIANLRSPHSVHVTDFGMSEHDLPYLVMDHVVGISLAEMIARNGKLTNLQTARFTLGVLDALEDAHGLGIVHRDLKPSNIICAKLPGSSLPAAKVLDFGIAKMLQGDDQNLAGADDTVEGVVFCSPRYASPEVLLGRPSLQSDIYSLGIAMIEALQGEPPYAESNKILVAAHHLGPAEVPVKDEIKESVLYSIIAKACAKDLNDRYQTASEMLDELQVVYDNLIAEIGDGELKNLDISMAEEPECFSGTPGPSLVSGTVPSFASSNPSLNSSPHTRPMPKPVMAGQSRQNTVPMQANHQNTLMHTSQHESNNGLLIGIAVFIIVVAIAAAVTLVNKEEEASPEVVVMAASSEEENVSVNSIARAFRTAKNRVNQATSIPREYRFSLRASVEGAHGSSGNSSLAPLPIENAFGSSVRPLSISITADGYQPFEHTFELSDPINYRAHLVPIGVATPQIPTAVIVPEAAPEVETAPEAPETEEERERSRRRRAERRARQEEREAEERSAPVEQAPDPPQRSSGGGGDLRDPFGR